eukprot:6947158-Pyramimonas_sp.AAC.1
MAERDSAVSKCRVAKLSHNGKTVWAKSDQPIQVRAPRSVLFGARKSFVQWGFSRNNLWADENTNTLTLGTEKVFEVAVEEGIMKISFVAGWEDYTKEYKEWKELVQTQTDKLQRAGTDKGKGKGQVATGAVRQ